MSKYRRVMHWDANYATAPTQFTLVYRGLPACGRKSPTWLVMSSLSHRHMVSCRKCRSLMPSEQAGK
jgi:hypothetical protein